MPKNTKEVNKNNTKVINSINTSNSNKTVQSKAVVEKSKSKKATNASTKKEVINKNVKTTVSKKATSNKKTPSKKNAKTKKTNNLEKQKNDILEYYDLPYRYNKTVVRVLAQTPKTLFVYWDISDEDRLNYIKQYGEHFFENTIPILVIHNTTMNYTFEIEINDFANCWYFNINDEKCEYLVELGRRPRENNTPDSNKTYIPITSSNKIESPNGHILLEKEQNVIYYKDVKSNKTYSKNIANLEFIKYFGKIYNIPNIYKEMYNEDKILDINNPTSSFK